MTKHANKNALILVEYVAHKFPPLLETQIICKFDK